MAKPKPQGPVLAARGQKMGVLGGRHCETCGVAVHWRIEKYCREFRQRFGGRIYCMRCQAAFPRIG